MLGRRHKIKRNGVVIWSESTKREAENLRNVFLGLEEQGAEGVPVGTYEIVDSLGIFTHNPAQPKLAACL